MRPIRVNKGDSHSAQEATETVIKKICLLKGEEVAFGIGVGGSWLAGTQQEYRVVQSIVTVAFAMHLWGGLMPMRNTNTSSKWPRELGHEFTK